VGGLSGTIEHTSRFGYIFYVWVRTVRVPVAKNEVTELVWALYQSSGLRSIAIPSLVWFRTQNETSFAVIHSRIARALLGGHIENSNCCSWYTFIFKVDMRHNNETLVESHHWFLARGLGWQSMGKAVEDIAYPLSTTFGYCYIWSWTSCPPLSLTWRSSKANTWVFRPRVALRLWLSIMCVAVGRNLAISSLHEKRRRKLTTSKSGQNFWRTGLKGRTLSNGHLFSKQIPWLDTRVDVLMIYRPLRSWGVTCLLFFLLPTPTNHKYGAQWDIFSDDSRPSLLRMRSYTDCQGINWYRIKYNSKDVSTHLSDERCCADVLGVSTFW
jgi:hypothetical protein